MTAERIRENSRVLNLSGSEGKPSLLKIVENIRELEISSFSTPSFPFMMFHEAYSNEYDNLYSAI